MPRHAANLAASANRDATTKNSPLLHINMTKDNPPRSPHSSLSSGKRSSSGSRKSPRTSSSDSPSASATNEHGRHVLHERLRSVLSHRLGLPLLYALHGKDPGTLKYLRKERRSLCRGEEGRLNGVFKEAVDEWKAGRIKKEPQLTKILVNKIMEQNTPFNALNELKVEEIEKPDGHIDIIFSEAKSNKHPIESTPFTVIEFGLSGIDWWKKLDQGIIYVDKMRGNTQQLPCVRFDKPLLLAVVTHDESACEGKRCEFRIGVFLCYRKDSDNKQDEYRISLLWHTESNTLEDASNMFGRLLRVTADFRLWRDNSDVQSDDNYEYFSSNCCKVGNNNNNNNNNAVVLRNYDCRVRKTNRSSEVYLSPECRNLVGEVEKIVELPGEDDIKIAEFDNCHINDNFWIKSKERTLLIIAAPYRHGCHVAKKPGAFMPIIDQLEELHKKKFVHGDIRAFNTVFGEQENAGWLIDFDFGGKLGSTCYPRGYRGSLADGQRLGDGDDEAANEVPQWHDWYALGRLIFVVHEMSEPPEGASPDAITQFFRVKSGWNKLSQDPSSEMIAELRACLGCIDEQGWTVSPNQLFEIELKKITALSVTNRGATGSPPEKKPQVA